MLQFILARPFIYIYLLYVLVYFLSRYFSPETEIIFTAFAFSLILLYMGQLAAFQKIRTQILLSSLFCIFCFRIFEYHHNERKDYSILPDQEEAYYEVKILNNTQYANRIVYTGLIHYKLSFIKVQITDWNSTLPYELLYGDTVGMCLNIQKINEPPNRYINPYDWYLLQNQVYIKATPIGSQIKVTKSNNWSLLRNAQFASRYLKNIFEQHKQFQATAQLLTGLLLGDKSSMEKSMKEAFRIGGISHILAVSGMHLGIFYLMLVFIFKQLRKVGISISSRFEILFILKIIWIYTMITGLGVAVCRSALMLSLYQLSILFNRKTQAINILFAGAFLLVLIHPGNLNDIGYQLSCLALLGIFWLSKYIQRLFIPSSIIGQYIWSVISVSFAVQLIITPVCLYHFHTFPLYFLLTNLLWAPLTPILMISGIVICMLYPISYSLSDHLMRVTDMLVELGMKVLHLLNKLPHASLDLIWFEPIDCILYFLAILFMGLYLKTQQTKYCLLMIFVQIFASIQYFIREQEYFKSPELIVISGKLRSDLILIEKGNCYKSSSMHHQLENYLKRRNIFVYHLAEHEQILTYLNTTYLKGLSEGIFCKLSNRKFHKNKNKITIIQLDETTNKTSILPQQN